MTVRAVPDQTRSAVREADALGTEGRDVEQLLLARERTELLRQINAVGATQLVLTGAVVLVGLVVAGVRALRR